ncbi:hypothetical protein POTOM_050023 [Populus tomentosa]|uniref:Protein yippee-like n=1 Tax=Populus tomentosa TaxID=118781 RepID=A0A8X7Y8F1_POPTO|nr:hypothetical protein POTOM_050023 [Populus tomentosa]
MAESGDYPFYSRRNCRNPLAFDSDLLSKAYKGRHMYMFSHVMNIVLGQKEDRKMLTGMYTVAAIFCRNCGHELGWKYVRAFDPSQRIKEGNFIVEKLKLVKEY